MQGTELTSLASLVPQITTELAQIELQKSHFSDWEHLAAGPTQSQHINQRADPAESRVSTSMTPSALRLPLVEQRPQGVKGD